MLGSGSVQEWLVRSWGFSLALSTTTPPPPPPPFVICQNFYSWKSKRHFPFPQDSVFFFRPAACGKFHTGLLKTTNKQTTNKATVTQVQTRPLCHPWKMWISSYWKVENKKIPAREILTSLKKRRQSREEWARNQLEARQAMEESAQPCEAFWFRSWTEEVFCNKISSSKNCFVMWHPIA